MAVNNQSGFLEEVQTPKCMEWPGGDFMEFFYPRMAFYLQASALGFVVSRAHIPGD